jgi:O-antigen/teichoic acid export membrane protein
VPERAANLIVNLAASGGGELVARIGQIAVLAIVGRLLGAAGLGIVGIAWSLYTILLSFVQVGPELVAIQRYAQAPRDGATRAALVARTTVLKLAIALAAIPVMLAASAVTGNGDVAVVGQGLVQATIFIGGALGCGWVFRAGGWFAGNSALRGGQAVAGLALLLPALLVWPSPLAVPAVEACVALLFGLIGWAMLAREPGAAVGAGTAAVGTRFGDDARAALLLGVGSFLSATAWTVAIPIVAQSLPVEQVGRLAAVLRLVIGLNSICQIGLQVCHPVLARLYKTDRAAGAAFAGALLWYATLLVLLGVAGLTAAADWMIPALLGRGLADVAPLFRLMVLALVPATIASVFGYGLLADARVATFTWISALATLATALGTWLAVRVTALPDAAAVMIPILAAQALASAYAARAAGLVAALPCRWVFAPAAVGRFLRQR